MPPRNMPVTSEDLREMINGLISSGTLNQRVRLALLNHLTSWNEWKPEWGSKPQPIKGTAPRTYMVDQLPTQVIIDYARWQLRSYRVFVEQHPAGDPHHRERWSSDITKLEAFFRRVDVSEFGKGCRQCNDEEPRDQNHTCPWLSGIIARAALDLQAPPVVTATS